MRIIAASVIAVLLLASTADAKEVFKVILQEYEDVGVRTQRAKNIANQYVYYTGDGLSCWGEFSQTPKSLLWTIPVDAEKKCQVIDRWQKAIPAMTQILFPKSLGSSPDLQKVQQFFLDTLKDEKQGRSVSGKKLKSGKYSIQFSTEPESNDEGAPVNVSVTFTADK